MNKLRSVKFGFLNPGSLGTKHDEFIGALLNHAVDIWRSMKPGLDGERKDAPPWSPGTG